MMEGKALLSVRDLTKTFGGLMAVNGVSFDIEKGTITALIGPNGAGKTTVINIISGLLRATGGKVVFKGRDITNLPPYRISHLGIARTFQNIRVFPQMTVLENMLVATRYRKGETLLYSVIPDRDVKVEDEQNLKKALHYLEFVGLMDKKDEFAGNLSHGQRRLLELARALATDADLLLLDEPTAGVTPRTREKILELFIRLKNSGKTIMIIEHNMKIVRAVSDRVIVLSNGQKIFDGPPDKAFKDSRVIEAYLGTKWRYM